MFSAGSRIFLYLSKNYTKQCFWALLFAFFGEEKWSKGTPLCLLSHLWWSRSVMDGAPGQMRVCASRAVFLARPFAHSRPGPAELLMTTFWATTWVYWLLAVDCKKGKWFLKSCICWACSVSFAVTVSNISVGWRCVTLSQCLWSLLVLINSIINLLVWCWAFLLFVDD